MVTKEVAIQKSKEILRAKQVAEKLSVSTQSIWNKCNEKHRCHDIHFPKPFKISTNVTGWLASDYIDYLAAQRKQA